MTTTRPSDVHDTTASSSKAWGGSRRRLRRGSAGVDAWAADPSAEGAEVAAVFCVSLLEPEAFVVAV